MWGPHVMGSPKCPECRPIIGEKGEILAHSSIGTLLFERLSCFKPTFSVKILLQDQLFSRIASQQTLDLFASTHAVYHVSCFHGTLVSSNTSLELCRNFGRAESSMEHERLCVVILRY